MCGFTAGCSGREVIGRRFGIKGRRDVGWGWVAGRPMSTQL
jgi:hypothetical protein